MREFYGRTEDAMDGKTQDGKDLKTYNDDKELKYGGQNKFGEENTANDNSANETAGNGQEWNEHVNSGKYDKQAETEYRKRIYDDDLQKRLDNLKLPMGGEDRTQYDAEKKAINDEQDLREFMRGKTAEYKEESKQDNEKSDDSKSKWEKFWENVGDVLEKPL
ncbi:MAG: hypothetical protein IKG79_09455, partial [Neisseriaceae bacterium]|nr:hypothetical protein [Neisseriaceae bacterium]